MPWDKQRYPKNWSEIRATVLNRAGHCCERCGKPNLQRVMVIMPGGFWYDTSTPSDDFSDTDRPGTWRSATGAPMSKAEEDRIWSDPDSLMPGFRMYEIKVVLTTAHVHDPDPQNCDLSNLQAWCQYCHNNHDAPMRAKNAAATRRRRAAEQGGQIELF